MKTHVVRPFTGIRVRLAAIALISAWFAAPLLTMADLPPIAGELEYFFNEDPGEGAGTVLPFTSREMSFTAMPSGLPAGTHTLYLRVRGDEGPWGPARPIVLTIEPSSNFERVAAWEASVGAPASPGAGQPLPVEGTPGTSATLSGRVNLTDATPGTETVYLRARDDAGTWGPAFPFALGVETSGEEEIPTAVQYAWLEADSPPVWRTRAKESPEGHDATLFFDPGLADVGLGTRYLALRALDSSNGTGPIFLVPVAIVPDSLTGHATAAEYLIAYARDAAGVIEGTGVELYLGAADAPASSYSFSLPIDDVEPGPVEVVAYLRMASGETSPLVVSAPVLVVVASTNGYAAWRTNETRFTEEEQADDSISGSLADPDDDGVSNQLEMAFGGDPLVPNRGILPVIEHEGVATVLRFRQLEGGAGHRAYNYTAEGVRYTVQYAFDPAGDWLEGGSEAFDVLSVEGNGDGTATVRVSLTPAVVDGHNRVFLRLKITLL